MSRRTTKPAPSTEELQVTPEEAKVEAKGIDPGNTEQEKTSEEPVAAAEAAPAEKIQTDVREKLAKKSTEDNVFVPSNPAALEKAASEVAKEQGFELNRGTSVGARLIARANKRI